MKYFRLHCDSDGIAGVDIYASQLSKMPPVAEINLIRTYLKKRILVQGVGGAGFLTAGILKYVEDLKPGTNTQIGPKDFFEIGSKNFSIRWPMQPFTRSGVLALIEQKPTGWGGFVVVLQSLL